MEEFNVTNSPEPNSEHNHQKPKIVVHINNYILSKTPSDDEIPLRLAAPENSVSEIMWTNQKRSPKIKRVIPPKNDYIILHAKSMKFPVKITPSYEIYPTTNINDNDKVEKHDKYERSDRKGKLSSVYNRYDKLNINFKLPPISPFQNNQIKNNMTYPNKAQNKMSLPNFLKSQYNHLLPTNSINETNKILKQKETNPFSNHVNSFNRLESSSKKQGSNILEPINQSNNLLEMKSPRNEYFNPNSTFIENANLKLPQINRTYEPEEYSVANHDIKAREESVNRFYNGTDQIDDEINKIIRNYPSIVMRRKGTHGEKKRKKLPTFLTENQISYHKASSIEPSVVSKARNDIAHTIDYGKLI